MIIQKIKLHKLTIINPRVNYFEAARMIQIKKSSTTGFQTFYKGSLILSPKRTTEKKLQSTRNYITTIFNPLMPGGNKRAYILKQTYS